MNKSDDEQTMKTEQTVLELRTWRFQPGVSGNPSGRPKNSMTVNTRAKRFTDEAIAVLAEVMRNPKARSASRVAAAIAILDRGWGKSREYHSVDTTSDFAEIMRQIDGRTRGLPPAAIAAEERSIDATYTDITPEPGDGV